MTRGGFVAVFALLLSGCGTATGAPSEDLRDPGPHDASVNNVLEFDGVDDYASVGTSRVPQIMRDQTLTLWFRPEAEAQDLQVLFTLRRSEWSGIALALDHDVPLAYNVFGPRDLARAPAPATLGKWHHLAYVIEPTVSTLYLDGASLAVGVAPATNRTPTQAFLGSLDGYSNLFHGAIDELRFYDRAFSADEIAAIAAGIKPSETEPLVLYLPFDELSGARAYDRSGLGNHAELGDGIPAAMPTRTHEVLP